MTMMMSGDSPTVSRLGSNMLKQLRKIMKVHWTYLVIVFSILYCAATYWRLRHVPVYSLDTSLTTQRDFVLLPHLREFDRSNLSNLIDANSLANSYGEIELGPVANGTKTPLIPHIIHQIWDSERVPEHFKQWILTWKKFHPNWQYWFWTHSEFKKLLEIVDPVFLKDFDGYKLGQSRADVMRFYIMYYFGGVYADLDVEVLKPLDYWTYSNHCILPEETHAHPFILNNYTHAPAMITLLLCRPGHPYFKFAISHIQEYTTRKYMKKLIFVDDMFQMYLKDEETLKHPENQIYLAPPKYFLPTWDAGNYGTLRHHCDEESYTAKMTKKQLETCAELEKADWKNDPVKESFTNHHWIHVVLNEAGWKKKTSVHIKDIIPERKNIVDIISQFKRKLNAFKLHMQQNKLNNSTKSQSIFVQNNTRNAVKK